MKKVTDCPECAVRHDHDAIYFHSGITTDLKPFVHLAWGEERGQTTPDELRAHARDLMAAAEAAESDSMVLRFLRDRVALDVEHLSLVLVDMRRYRISSK